MFEPRDKINISLTPFSQSVLQVTEACLLGQGHKSDWKKDFQNLQNWPWPCVRRGSTLNIKLLTVHAIQGVRISTSQQG